MHSRSKLGLITLFIMAVLVLVSRLSHLPSGVLGLTSWQTFRFEYEQSLKEDENTPLGRVVQQNLANKEGSFAVYIENLKSGEKYGWKEKEIFPAASLYKLILMAAVLQEVEEGRLKLEDVIQSNKTHLSEIFGGEDFGYEEAPENITYSVDEALVRVGRISDNFASIMLTEKLQAVRLSKYEGQESDDPKSRLLVKMIKELKMDHTSFDGDPISTTAADVAAYFKQLYQGQVVSPKVSEEIIKYLELSKIDNRIPAKLPEGVRVIHKTGELSRIRHDAGIVYLDEEQGSASAYNSSEARISSSAYVIVLFSKDLKYEDDGIEVLANISKDVYEYFAQKN